MAERHSLKNQTRVPWLWIIALSFPAGMAAFVEKCSGTALVFTLKKFVHDPQAIVCLTSLNILFGILVAPWVAWKSDQTTTPMGRRKPFMLAGLTVLAICLVLLPQAQSLPMVIVVIVVYQFSMDFGFTGLWRPLYADLVPNAQRGRGMVMNRGAAMVMRLMFMLFLIGQFDRHYGRGGGQGHGTKGSIMNTVRIGSLTGEDLIYYSAAVLVILTILFLFFLVREPSVSVDAVRCAPVRFRLKAYISSLFDSPSLRRLYWLVIAATLMSSKLGALRVLLFTDQFHFSKQMMGNVHSVSMIVNGLVILPLGAMLVDRVNRWRFFAVCLVLSTIQPIVFWAYVHFVCAVPDPRVVIGFHVFDAAFDHLGWIALWPLLYEHLSAGCRGTAQAGFLVVGGITSFVVMNLMGVWIKAYSHWFMTPETYDYMSGYLLVFVLGLAACGLTFATSTRRSQHNSFESS